MLTPEEQSAADAAAASASAASASKAKPQPKTAADELKRRPQYITLREFQFDPSPSSAEVVRTRIYTVGSRFNEADLPAELVTKLRDAKSIGVAKQLNQSVPEAVRAMVESD